LLDTTILYSPWSKNRIIRILEEQVEQCPSLLRCLFSLNIARYVGNSEVCGVVQKHTFELRNRKDPFFSLRAQGELK
jgi:hypothetical protein